MLKEVGNIMGSQTTSESIDEKALVVTIPLGDSHRRPVGILADFLAPGRASKVFSEIFIEKPAKFQFAL
jgi:hypothetical protein